MSYRNRSLTTILSALCSALLLVAASEPAAAANDVSVCHIDEEGNVLTLNINASAEAAHLGHGDYSLVTFFLDGDGDSYGNPAITTLACLAPAGYVDNAGDCNDSEPLAWTGAAEILGDGVDNDCDPATPDIIIAECPCTDLWVQSRAVWEAQRNRSWLPTLVDDPAQTICYEIADTGNPNYRATDFTFAVHAYGPAGHGCYSVVREDERPTGGDVELLINTLIPYDSNQAIQDAEVAACRTELLETCHP